MKLSQYIAKLKEVATTLANSQDLQKRVVLPAALSVLAEYKKRIFVNGKDSRLRKIGKYNVKTPFYVNPTKATGLPKKGLKPTQGKTGQKVFKNGNPHKTKYFASYSDFRKAVGRQNAFVDLNLTGSLFESVGIATQGGKIVLGYGGGDFKKMLGNEKRFRRDIKSLSNKDRQIFQDAVSKEIKFIIQQILSK